MIIDCHGHYTTEPVKMHEWRQAQLVKVENGGKSTAERSWTGLAMGFLDTGSGVCVRRISGLPIIAGQAADSGSAVYRTVET